MADKDTAVPATDFGCKDHRDGPYKDCPACWHTLFDIYKAEKARADEQRDRIEALESRNHEVESEASDYLDACNVKNGSISILESDLRTARARADTAERGENCWREQAGENDLRAAELEAEVSTVKAHHQSACETVAAMHEAAVGEVRGPPAGVVEDVAALKAEVDELRSWVGVSYSPTEKIAELEKKLMAAHSRLEDRVDNDTAKRIAALEAERDAEKERAADAEALLVLANKIEATLSRCYEHNEDLGQAVEDYAAARRK